MLLQSLLALGSISLTLLFADLSLNYLLSVVDWSCLLWQCEALDGEGEPSKALKVCQNKILSEVETCSAAFLWKHIALAKGDAGLGI